MKRILTSFIFGSLLLIATNVWAYEARMVNANGNPGDAVNVRATFNANAGNIYGVETWFEYDPSVLRIDSWDAGSLFGNFFVDANFEQPGVIKVGMIGDAITPASGDLMTLNFTILSSALLGNSLIRMTKMVFTRDNQDELPTNFSEGAVGIAGLVTVGPIMSLRMNVFGDGFSGFVTTTATDDSGNPVFKIANCPPIPGYFACYQYPQGTRIRLAPSSLSQIPFSQWTQCPGTVTGNNCDVVLDSEKRAEAWFAVGAQLMNFVPAAVLPPVNAQFNWDQGRNVNVFRLEVEDADDNLPVFASPELQDRMVVAPELVDDGQLLRVKLFAGKRVGDVVQWMAPQIVEARGFMRYGDVNEDTNLTMKDVRLALHLALGKTIDPPLTPVQIRKADVDTVTGVTLRDALLILQRVLGKIQRFPIEP